MAIEKKQLGAAIKRLRTARGLSQVQLAKAAGLSHSGNSVALIERGERSVSLDTLNALASALNVPPACVTILGSSRIEGSQAATELMKTLQRLITTTIMAQVEMQAEEEAEKAKPAKNQHKASAGIAKILKQLPRKKQNRSSKHDSEVSPAKATKRRRKAVSR